MRLSLALLCPAWLIACGEVTTNSPDAPAGDGPNVVEPGDARWVRSLSALFSTGVAEGPSGLVITGYMTAPVEIGGDTLVPVGTTDSVVAAYSFDGKHQYSTRFGGAGQEYGFLESADAGTPIVHGVSYGNVDLGAGEVPGGGGMGADGFIGRYGPGAPGWVKRITGPLEEKVSATAPGPGGSIYVAGFFEGAATYFDGTGYVSDGSPNASDATRRDAFVSRLNVFTGALQLTVLHGSPTRNEASAIAASGTDFVVAGNFASVLRLEGTPAAELMSAGSLDIYIAKYTATGALIWAVRHGGTGDDRDSRLAVDSAGDIYVTGQFQNQVAFGQINLIANGAGDVFVAKLRGSDGNVLWATSFGSTLDDGGSRIALDARGNVAVGAFVGGPLDGGPSAGGRDPVIATFDAATGAKRWRRTYSTAGDDGAPAVIYGADGDLYATLGLDGPFDFGVPLLGALNPVSVLLRLAP